jgi:hypothetical protein
MNTMKADQRQAEIYRKMPAKKKAEVWSAFYKAGKLLEVKENDRRSNKSSNRNRQDSRRA